LIRYHASWVLPIDGAPVRDGWVAVDGGRIVACGGGRDRQAGPAGAREVDLGDAAILPGLVNAHTHLELSYLRGGVPPATSFVTWIRGVLAARGQEPAPGAPQVMDSIDLALRESIASGTAVVGDISNTLATFAPLARSPLAAVLFYELIRFGTPDPRGFVEEAYRKIHALGPSDRVHVSLAAHAPYSVAPSVFRAIRDAVDRDPSVPCSVHLSESAEEVEFVRTGGGPWRQLLTDLGAWDPTWVAPGVTPVQFLDDSGFLDDRVLAVHGVQMTSADLARLAARGTTVVACPRSNRHTGAGVPPIEAFYASGVRVAVGTDSLASTPDLNVFAELAAMRALAPSVPAARLLSSATWEGARALGFDKDYGTIQPGKSARLLAVDLPAGTEDVEEYLVSGIHPEQIRWISNLQSNLNSAI
jgi:cytosine/adenosine deaminase-related metal-dependent hydrolase